METKLTVSPSQAKACVKACLVNGLPILLVGEPGVAKTALVAEACQELGWNRVESHPAVDDPTDGKGLPPLAGDATAFRPIGQVAEVLKASRPTCWNLEDLGSASPAVQAAYQPWIRARCNSGHALPDHVEIVATSNDRSHRANVTAGILEPVKSRFTTILHVRNSVEDWCSWAFGGQAQITPPTSPAPINRMVRIPEEILPMGAAFLRFRPELLSKFEATASMTNSPSPRTWENAFKLASLPLAEELLLPMVAGAVGEAAGAEFVSFLKLSRDMPNLDGILMAPEQAPIPSQVSVLYAVSSGLAYRVTPQNCGQVFRYAERLHEAGHGEFGVLILRDSIQKDPNVMQTAAFVRMASSNLGKLAVGRVD